jgi:hypothetical protein
LTKPKSELISNSLIHTLLTISVSLSIMVAVFPLLVSSLFAAEAMAQTTLAETETALDVLQVWYNMTTGLWNTCGWWNGANCMTAIADLAKIDSSVMDTAVSVFENTWVNAPSVNPGEGLEKVMMNGAPKTIYPADWPHHTLAKHQKQGVVNTSAWLDGAYDDDDWWAHAWIAAYDVTSNQDYLDLAIGIFEDLVSLGQRHASFLFLSCSFCLVRGLMLIPHRRLLCGQLPAVMAESTGTLHAHISTPFPMSCFYLLRRTSPTVCRAMSNTMSSGPRINGNGSRLPA